MTDQPVPVNGRVTQRDLYDAIGRVDAKLDSHYHRLDERLRRVEMAIQEEQAHDDERALMIREQRQIRAEQGVSRRWLLGIGVTVAMSLMASLSSLAVSLT